MRTFRFRAAMLGLATGIVFAVAGVAAAHTVNYDATVTIHFKPGHKGSADTFSGDVTSDKASCQRRRIRLIQKQETGNVKIATDHTDKTGAWEIQLPAAAPGTYFAKATKRVLRDTPKHLHVCNPASSKDITVHK
jgi:hypothetical protein